MTEDITRSLPFALNVEKGTLLGSHKVVSLNEVEQMVSGAEPGMKNAASGEEKDGAVHALAMAGIGRSDRGRRGQSEGRGGRWRYTQKVDKERRGDTGVWCNYHRVRTHSIEKCNYQRNTSGFGYGGEGDSAGSSQRTVRQSPPAGRGTGGREGAHGQ